MDLKEQLSSIEHERWAGWQQYLHSKGTINADGDLVIPRSYIKHWERQIALSYTELSEEEKESDRKEVERYWPLIQEIIDTKNGAYHERNMLVAALSKIYPAHLQKHDASDATWERDWLNIVCIHIPTVEAKQILRNGVTILGYRREKVEQQVTWHIHDSDLPMFRHLKVEPNHWDGHSTEEKYKRLETIRKD